MKNHKHYFVIFLMIFSLNSCCKKHAETIVDPSGNPKPAAGPPVLIYKTRANYYYQVPVVLNDEKTSIVSYPGVTDIYYNGDFAYPTSLEKDYWLDNRGIGKNVAFLKYTYQEYAALGKTPDAKELYNNILDKEPLTELYDAGTRYQYKDLLPELNALILKGDFSTFKKLK